MGRTIVGKHFHGASTLVLTIGGGHFVHHNHEARLQRHLAHHRYRAETFQVDLDVLGVRGPETVANVHVREKFLARQLEQLTSIFDGLLVFQVIQLVHAETQSFRLTNTQFSVQFRGEKRFEILVYKLLLVT